MTRSPALAWSRKILRLLVVLNLLYAAGVAVMLAMSLVPGTILWEALGMLDFPDSHRARIEVALRGVMLLGIVGALIVDRVLRQLQAIVATVEHGDPFIAGNARRLEAIAWWVLAGEGVRLLIGAIAWGATSGVESLDLDLHFSWAPWLAVLLLFVLARVFDEGTRMRRDLDGTV
jgi:hypothetical protein